LKTCLKPVSKPVFDLQVRDELSSEVTRLNEELEQMKTRVAEITKDARKTQVNTGTNLG
jgi:hypothetical protein